MLRYLCLLFCLILVACESNVATKTDDLIPNASKSASSSAQFAIATAHPLATQAGIKILQQGGNAFDAAVAVTAALAVVEPYASGLGGGGFWLLHLAKEDHDVMIDGREVAPLAATRDLYIGSDGNITQQSIIGALAAGIPGTPAALVHIAENYGHLPLTKTLQPAIDLAQNGFAVSEFYIKRANAVLERMKKFPHTAEIFLQQGEAPKAGFILRQTELSEVLTKISQQGNEGFYHGEVAESLVHAVQKAGGIWQLEDLLNYEIVERQPITGRYKDLHIVSATLPSSGGIVMLQVLNMLANYDLQIMDDAQRKHHVIEAMRRAYHDRAQYLGDQDFVDVPVEDLLSAEHAAQRMSDFSAQHATQSKDLVKANSTENDVLELDERSQNTTHFSILDQHGNRVAATLSINYFFGSGFVAEGTGVLLNNEMDDFVTQPGHANLWGLVGNEANAIEPGKRMLSSMSPTFLSDGKRMAILGTPGGSRIITMVLLSSLAFMQGATAEQMVSLPRYHHQFLPDVVQYEPDAFSKETILKLNTKGHMLKQLQISYGNMQVVLQDLNSKKITAASDPRGIGVAHISE